MLPAFQADESNDLGDAPGDLGPCHAFDTQAVFDVLSHAHPGKHGIVLKDHDAVRSWCGHRFGIERNDALLVGH